MKLISQGTEIRTDREKYICSISMTDRLLDLVEDVGWEKGKESWLDWRKRSEQEREEEREKSNQLARDIVLAYNEKFGN